MRTLEWIGKRAVLNHHREIPFHVVKPNADLSAGDPDAGNLIVQGDKWLTMMYPRLQLYDGGYQFRKHLFPLVGELPGSGEEHDCAVFLDQHTLVASWVRNIANRPATSFSLQTSSDGRCVFVMPNGRLGE